MVLDTSSIVAILLREAGYERLMERITLRILGANPSLNVDSSLFGRVTAQRNTDYGRQFQYTGRVSW